MNGSTDPTEIARLLQERLDNMFSGLEQVQREIGNLREQVKAGHTGDTATTVTTFYATVTRPPYRPNVVPCSRGELKIGSGVGIFVPPCMSGTSPTPTRVLFGTAQFLCVLRRQLGLCDLVS